MSTNNKNINLQIPRFSNLSGGFKNLPIVFEGKMGKMKDITSPFSLGKIYRHLI